MNLKHFEVSKQNTLRGSRRFRHLCFHPSNPLSCAQTDCRACVLWVFPATDPRLNWLSQRVKGLPASSCGLGATVRPVALSPSVSLCVRDIIVSVLVVLKSPLVDVEDFDRVVSAGTGELEPGALLLDFTLCVGLSIFPVVLSTYSTGPGPPAEPLDRQRVALSVRICDEGKQQDWLNNTTSSRQITIYAQNSTISPLQTQTIEEQQDKPKLLSPHDKITGHRHTVRG